MTDRLCRSVVMVLLAGALLLAAGQAQAADSAAQQNWPQWRGPLGTGVAPAADPPTTWSETQNIRWKVKIPGTGAATPIVWGDRVFVQTAIPTGRTGAAELAAPPPAAEAQRQQGRRGRGGFGGGQRPTEIHQFVILCLDRRTGDVLWQQVAREEVPHQAHHPREGNFSGPSPVTDGEHIFAYFGSRGLYCYDMEGNLKWSQDFGDMRIALNFGEGSSPALHGDTIVINWDHEDESFIIALDKNTGKTLWKNPREEGTSWSTPLIVEHDGRAQVVTAASNRVRAYDLASGELIWECGGLTGNVVPSPVAADGLVYVMSGFRGNALLAIRLGRSGDLTGTDAIVWTHRRGTPYVPSPLLYGDKLYFFSNNNEVLSCFDARSGRPLVEMRRIDGLSGIYASPVGAAGRVYLVGRNGATVVIKQSDQIEVLATNQLNDGFDASPAIAGNELFLRGREHVYCLGAGD